MAYDYYLSKQQGNTKLIISSHGGYLGSAFKTPINLHFMSKQNYVTRGQVTNVLAMAAKEFETESSGTSSITDYQLSFFEHDVPANINEAVQNGMDVITIKAGKKVKLSTILTDMPTWGLGYTDVYCMFCRVPMQASRVKVM
jgi:hypothetical protein